MILFLKFYFPTKPVKCMYILKIDLNIIENWRSLTNIQHKI